MTLTGRQWLTVIGLAVVAWAFILGPIIAILYLT